MSGFFRCQVSIPTDSGQGADHVVNVWHFDSDQTFAEDADDVAGRLATFYQSIDQMMPGTVGPSATIKVYDLADPEPRTPGVILDVPLSPAGSGSGMPEEVAFALSMKAAPQSGINPARLRGRVFLGPFTTSALELVSGRMRVTAAFRNTILTAAETLATGPDAGDGRLAVFSPTIYAAGGGNAAALDAAFNDVVELSMDDAVDIIRSRGPKPTGRIIVPVVP